MQQIPALRLAPPRSPPQRKRSASQNVSLACEEQLGAPGRAALKLELDIRKAPSGQSRSPGPVKSISANKRSRTLIFSSDEESGARLPRARGKALGSVSSINAHLRGRRRGPGRSPGQGLGVYSKQALVPGDTTFVRNRGRPKANLGGRGGAGTFGEDFFENEQFPNSVILGNRVKDQRIQWTQRGTKAGRTDAQETQEPSALFGETRGQRAHGNASGLLRAKTHAPGSFGGEGSPPPPSRAD